MGPSIVIKGTGLTFDQFLSPADDERKTPRIPSALLSLLAAYCVRRYVIDQQCRQFGGTISSLKQLPYLSRAGGSSQLVMIPQSFSCDIERGGNVRSQDSSVFNFSSICFLIFQRSKRFTNGSQLGTFPKMRE